MISRRPPTNDSTAHDAPLPVAAEEPIAANGAVPAIAANGAVPAIAANGAILADDAFAAILADMAAAHVPVVDVANAITDDGPMQPYERMLWAAFQFAEIAKIADVAD